MDIYCTDQRKDQQVLTRTGCRRLASGNKEDKLRSGGRHSKTIWVGETRFTWARVKTVANDQLVEEAPLIQSYGRDRST